MPASSAAMVTGNGMMAPASGIYSNGAATPTGETLTTPVRIKAKDKEKEQQGLRSSTKATVVVELPENAKLFVDDMPVEVSAGLQTFDTPALEPGRDYYYMVRIETKRDGKPLSQTRLVIVRAGQVARAAFKEERAQSVRTVQAN